MVAVSLPSSAVSIVVRSSNTRLTPRTITAVYPFKRIVRARLFVCMCTFVRADSDRFGGSNTRRTNQICTCTFYVRVHNNGVRR